MMAEDKNKNVGQEEVDVITLEFEEGEPVDCEIMSVFVAISNCSTISR